MKAKVTYKALGILLLTTPLISLVICSVITKSFSKAILVGIGVGLEILACLLVGLYLLIKRGLKRKQC